MNVASPGMALRGIDWRGCEEHKFLVRGAARHGWQGLSKACIGEGVRSASCGQRRGKEWRAAEGQAKARHGREERNSWPEARHDVEWRAMVRRAGAWLGKGARSATIVS